MKAKITQIENVVRLKVKEKGGKGKWQVNLLDPYATIY